MDTTRWTYFHLPEEGPYDPLSHTGTTMKWEITTEGYVPVSQGDEITLEGHLRRFRVSRVSFHLGHEADLAGLHVFLEEGDADRRGA